MQNDNPYLDLTTYTEIYQELIYQRNESIRWLTENGLLDRNKHVSKSDENEWNRHKIAATYHHTFQQAILALLDRLYSHDAIEAIYDFNSVELGTWTETEANTLERKLQSLQLVISKLETRYHLQYKITFQYNIETCTLYQNTIEIFSCRHTTLRNRLLVALFSDPKRLWEYDDIENYFIKHFGYKLYQLTSVKTEKAANDIKKDVASKTAAQEFLVVKNSTIRINPTYLL